MAEDEEQLLATIRSRCQITYFKKLQEIDIVKGLLAEGAAAQNAKQIAIVAEGNFNKALEPL